MTLMEYRALMKSKAERNKRVLAAAEDGEMQTLIAAREKISRERVRQILKKLGFKKKKWLHFCATPGCPRTKSLHYRIKGPTYCQTCSTYKAKHKHYPDLKTFKRHHEKRVCKECGYKQKGHWRREFWSRDLCKRCGMKQYRLDHPEYVEKMRQYASVRNKKMAEYYNELNKQQRIMSLLYD